MRSYPPQTYTRRSRDSPTGPDFAAVLSDVRMLGLGGAELFNEVAARWPALAQRFFFLSAAPVSMRISGIPGCSRLDHG